MRNELLNGAERARRIIQSRLGGRVERCHSIPHQGSYSNAAHSWGVAMLLWYLFPSDFARLAPHCLTHDIPEGWLGDIPSTTLLNVSGIREELVRLERMLADDLGFPFEGDLDPSDYAILKACDRLELFLWCCEQVALGNVYAEAPLSELRRMFATTAMPQPAAEFYRVLQGMDPIPRQAGVVRELVERADAEKL